MLGKPLTISETIGEIREALKDYIEATYHIGNPRLVSQRRKLLDEVGVIFQVPYLETTPKYLSGATFGELGLGDAARDLLQAMAHPQSGEAELLRDPPYRHQAKALELALNHGRSLVVMTGTGSGKTESFLLPILGKIAMEAKERPISFAVPAVRAILLYPMNALVNDQLGRLRLMLGDPRVSHRYVNWAGRPARFARYTSRTLYPGVRTAKKDQQRLRPIGQFYVDSLDKATAGQPAERVSARTLIDNLRARGKWPAKPDLAAWYGQSGGRWQNQKGQFVRAVTLPDDAELLTRDEVLKSPPDVLVTNYSMLEYMLMRPLERPIFDATRAWLEANPNERLILVIDEAHLYRGAAGAEVGLLLRRLRARLGIPSERLQIICTSASFSDPELARAFGAQLSGKVARDFEAVTGELAVRPNEGRGSQGDAEMLAAVAVDEFYGGSNDAAQFKVIKSFLDSRKISATESVETALFEALKEYPPMSLLVNLTMKEAMPLEELGREIFNTEDRALADKALTALVAFGSVARRTPGEPGLMPARIHTFFRGLPGLWACLDSDCPFVDEKLSPGPAGKLFAQPRDACLCGARVFELYTCRQCGAAYARAYTDNVQEPSYLWSEPGGGFLSVSGVVSELQPLDLCLEEPMPGEVEPGDLDLVTGRLNPNDLGERTRQVFLRRNRDPQSTSNRAEGIRIAEPGEFRPCGVCGESAAYGRSSVQDHQTKGDQPFQALITRQIQVQPPGRQPYSDFAPLQGRKVLAFSDSRQTAARLAPNLQTYSMQDVLRPLILVGFRELQAVEGFQSALSLEDLFLAVLLAAARLKIRLRPELRAGESLHAQIEVQEAVRRGTLSDPGVMLQLLLSVRGQVPQSLLRGLVTTITDRYYGLQSLALASIAERRGLRDQVAGALPPLATIATERDEKLAVARCWLNQWTNPGIWFQGMTPEWWQTARGVRPHSGKFAPLMRWLGSSNARRDFERDWLPVLLATFCDTFAPGKYRLKAGAVTLNTEGSWGYCQTCRTTQRPFQDLARCISCGRDRVTVIDPTIDPVFSARKAYYRSSTVRALAMPPDPPMAIIAAEHTAQLNAAQAEEVFSKAEEHELLFQDVDLGPDAAGVPRTAIDVLSCTTTMEVGIDIGTLSGVALRNMPPSRASYQQRSGRAGRRGNVVATVIAFGSVDSHDEHYFREPDAMIRGRVEDPLLTLDNAEIARRHVTAFLLQRYHQVRLPEINPEDQPQLFEVLGTVAAFKNPASTLNREDFEQWLRQEVPALTDEVDSWLPRELEGAERQNLLAGLVEATLVLIDGAISDKGGTEQPAPEVHGDPKQADDGEGVEAVPEPGEERDDPRKAVENLLDRLLYRGVLPRYAFPTDVVAFHVFNREESTLFRPVFQYAPGQGLPMALSQYAPGKDVWIDGKLWRSGALYSPMRSDLYVAWQSKKLYFECTNCHYAKTENIGEAERGEVRDCPACGGQATFGGAKNWIRPPGFAHPQSDEEGTSPDDLPARSYATRAKLVAPGPADQSNWKPVADRLRQYYHRTHLLVTNTGPRQEGYSYCTRCGLIEPTALPVGRVSAPHPKPFPDPRHQDCPGGASTRGLVLGTDFISDVVLISATVDPPVTLRPGYLATDVALRTMSEALTIAATRRLEVEADELQAEYRPALTQRGREGLEAEIYIYDTLAGGAGFSRRIAELGLAVFLDALLVLENCPSDCDRSCYRCLRSFKNRFEHELLDRHLGASLLRYLISGAEPVLDEARLELAADRLFADLSRLGVDGVAFNRKASVNVPGIGSVEAPILAQDAKRRLIIGIHGPLTPDHTGDASLRDAKEFSGALPVLLVDEIVVARSLPFASRQVIQAFE